MKRSLALTMMLAASVSVAGCAGITEFAGKLAGNQVGKKIAVAPKAKTAPIARGGEFCKTLTSMGGPFPIDAADTRPTQDVLLNIDEHGEKYCGWKPPT